MRYILAIGLLLAGCAEPGHGGFRMAYMPALDMPSYPQYPTNQGARQQVYCTSFGSIVNCF